jgi:isopenicillin N synthase-like dioxygenase
MGKIPTISLMDTEDKIVGEMKEACMQNGFFQVTDYDKIMSPELSVRTLEASRRFFDLPLDMKRSLFKPDHISGGYEPYKALNLEPTNPRGYGHNEGFSFASPAFPTAWPSESQLSGFRQTMEEYYRAVTSIAQSIGCYLAVGLDLPKEYFDDFFEAQLAHVKLAHYYRPEGDVNESMIGVAPHTDWGAVLSPFCFKTISVAWKCSISKLILGFM